MCSSRLGARAERGDEGDGGEGGVNLRRWIPGLGEGKGKGGKGCSGLLGIDK